MDDQTGTKVSTEEASTNLYWTFGNEEVFNLQTTVRGAINDAQITAHLASVKAAMKAIVQLGGHAKQIGQQQTSPAQTNGHKSEFETYIGAKGKRFVKIPEGMEQPNEITCEIHGKKMKRNSNERGAWYSHKDGKNWCSAAVPGKQS